MTKHRNRSAPILATVASKIASTARWSRTLSLRKRGGAYTLTTLEDKLRALVEIPTVTGQFEAAHQALAMTADYLKQRGMHITWHTYDGFECFVATTRPTKTPTVYLYAHLDVVPASADLFILRKEAGNYIGRGVYDMKVSLAAYMQLVDDLGGSLPKYDFGIMVVSDEEFGSKSKVNNDSGFSHLLEDGYLGKVYIMPDGGRDWQLESSSKGFMHYILKAKGTAAHGSRPWEGENAVDTLMDALTDIRSHFKDHGPDTDTLNVGSIMGGEVANRIPHEATAELDLRPNDIGSRERLIALVERICKKHGVEAFLNADLSMMRTDLTNPYLVAFADSIKKVVGVEARGVKSFGGSDARFLMHYNLPAAVFYPFGGGHHSNKEWLPEGELERMRDVMADYVKKIAHHVDK